MKNLLLTLTLIASATAFASDEQFTQLDADKSGTLSMEEAKAEPAVADAFAKLDSNADGALSHEEFAAMAPAEPAPKAEAPATETK